MTNDKANELIARLHAETALIGWHELQRFFAQGKVLHLSVEADLVATAAMLAEDRAEPLKNLLDSGQLKSPDNDKARLWYAENTELWCVVVAPYVLVQEPSDESAANSNNHT